MDFPLEWGIGSSSTMVVNLAKAFDLDAMEIGKDIFKEGSLYDVATAMASKPLLYKNDIAGPGWKESSIREELKSKIYFVHLNEKANTKDAIKLFYNNSKMENCDIEKISTISKKMTEVFELEDFEALMLEHENLVSKILNTNKIGDKLFSDFWGQTKSLGAWGGDFIMATSDKSSTETKDYFSNLGYNTVLSFDELIYH
jgi:mevalonate kinase